MDLGWYILNVRNTIFLNFRLANCTEKFRFRISGKPVVGSLVRVPSLGTERRLLDAELRRLFALSRFVTLAVILEKLESFASVFVRFDVSYNVVEFLSLL